MTTLAPLSVTGIGSVPYNDPEEAVSLVLRHLPELPYWPQLVRLSFLEEMVAQGAGGLPALKVDLEARQVLLDPNVSREMALAQFYETVWGGDLAPFALAVEEARGFHALLTRMAEQGNGAPALRQNQLRVHVELFQSVGVGLGVLGDSHDRREGCAPVPSRTTPIPVEQLRDTKRAERLFDSGLGNGEQERVRVCEQLHQRSARTDGQREPELRVPGDTDQKLGYRRRRHRLDEETVTQRPQAQ